MPSCKDHGADCCASMQMTSLDGTQQAFSPTAYSEPCLPLAQDAHADYILSTPDSNCRAHTAYTGLSPRARGLVIPRCRPSFLGYHGEVVEECLQRFCLAPSIETILGRATHATSLFTENNYTLDAKIRHNHKHDHRMSVAICCHMPVTITGEKTRNVHQGHIY